MGDQHYLVGAKSTKRAMSVGKYHWPELKDRTFNSPEEVVAAITGPVPPNEYPSWRNTEWEPDEAENFALDVMSLGMPIRVLNEQYALARDYEGFEIIRNRGTMWYPDSGCLSNHLFGYSPD